ncbi:hypothetical protein EIP86_004044 [Pleurotus ostreatoroseus]|nr:hypothetical protein EIP86_004044 [Pleurotus ostreatoroseus]
MSAHNLILKESTSSTFRNKPIPKPSGIPVPFEYNASDDGTDENLLILLHGLGDTQKPFARLGKSLKLPQTATLALRAPDLIPFLYEEAYQWYTSFDPLGDLLSNPNPTPAVELLVRVFTYLTQECAWPPERIHLFGFAQGGTVTAEAGVQWWRKEQERARKAQISEVGDSGTAAPVPGPRALGSIVSVGGPLLSYPTSQPPCPTPVLVAHRPSELPAGAVAAFKKAFSSFTDVSMGRGEGMPRSRDEWEPIMRFWSEKLARRQMDGLYEVMSGTAP